MQLAYYFGVVLLLMVGSVLPMEKKESRHGSFDREFAELQAAATLPAAQGRSLGQAIRLKSAAIQWLVDLSAQVFIHKGAVQSAYFNEDYSKISTCCLDRVLVWNVETIERVNEFRLLAPDLAEFISDKHLALTHSGSELTILTSTDGKKFRSFDHGTHVLALASNSSGSLLASAGPDGFVKIWHLETGAVLHKIQTSATGATRSVSFDSSGSQLLTADDRDGVVVWDVASGKPIYQQPLAPHKSIMAAAFHPEGTHIAALSATTFFIIDRETQELISQPLAQGAAVKFDKEGSRIAVGLLDGSIKLFNLVGRELFCLHAHEAAVRTVTFNRSGTLLLSASRDGTAKIWDLDLIEFLFNHISVAQTLLVYQIFDGYTRKKPGVKVQITGDWVAPFFSLPGKIQSLLAGSVEIRAPRKKSDKSRE